jgi:hypothetical protein
VRFCLPTPTVLRVSYACHRGSAEAFQAPGPGCSGLRRRAAGAAQAEPRGGGSVEQWGDAAASTAVSAASSSSDGVPCTIRSMCAPFGRSVSGDTYSGDEIRSMGGDRAPMHPVVGAKPTLCRRCYDNRGTFPSACCQWEQSPASCRVGLTTED